MPDVGGNLADSIIRTALWRRRSNRLPSERKRKVSEPNAAQLLASRKRGRPNRLSREAIIDATIDLLAETELDRFSMNLLARRLDAGVMSLYTYFPGRDALLLAAADVIYSRFEQPPPAERWQDQLRGWLQATVKLLDLYPVAKKLVIWDGHVSPAWLRTWFPIVALIRDQGLEGPRLAVAVSWFSTMAMGFITVQMQSPSTRHASTIANVDALEAGEQRLASELWVQFAHVDRDESLALGFDAIIHGMERLISGERGGSRDEG